LRDAALGVTYPRMIAPPRSRRSAIFVAAGALLALALGPGALAEALRSGTALALEAAPFVLVPALLEGGVPLGRPAPWRARAAALLRGAGCCGAGSGAAAIVPFALACATFGWPLAVVRAAAACAAGRLRGRAESCGPAAPPPTTLLRIGSTGALAHVAGGLVLAHAPLLVAHAGRLGPAAPAARLAAGLVACGLGAAIGALAPCGVGAILLAAATAAVLPAFGAGLLATSGIVRPLWLRHATRGHARGAEAHDAPGLAVVALACTFAALRHGDALVNPRLTPLLVAGAGAATALVRPRARRASTCEGSTGRRFRGLAPAVLLPVLLLPATPPATGTATSLADGAPGDRLVLVGRIERGAAGANAAATRLVRWHVFCCVADAELVVVPLRHPPDLAPGGWVRLAGRLVRTASGLALEVERTERLPPPADPYDYA